MPASRAEAVALADAWAVAGAKSHGRPAAQHYLVAAGLRERLYRLEHREPDALEAIELYAQAAHADPSSACQPKLALALLRAELKRDPGRAYRDLSRARSESSPGECRVRAERALAILDAYHEPVPLSVASAVAETPAKEEPGPVASGALAADATADAGVPAEGGPNPITQVERYGALDAARVVVFVTRPATFKVGFLDSEGARPRLFVDIAGATISAPKTLEMTGLVERVRVANRNRAARVVLDLAAPAYHQVFYVPEPFRLIIDVSKQAPARVDPARAGPRRVRRVVLDPGHGGHDPGATGPSGLREKDVTLDIAHRAAPLIAREIGASTLLTRDGDDFVSLDERTARANAFQADLFISIHCNATEDGTGSGVMTFVLDDSRDATAARIAARENSASAAAAAELATAMSQGRDGTGTQASAHFAELLQRAAMGSLAPYYPGIPDWGVKRAGFYVLAGAHMPAVLFESSFISSRAGEMRFNTGDFRQKIADAIVNAIRAYRDGL